MPGQRVQPGYAIDFMIPVRPPVPGAELLAFMRRLGAERYRQDPRPMGCTCAVCDQVFWGRRRPAGAPDGL